MPLPEYVSELGPGSWRVLVRVVPGAKRDEADGIHAGRLKIRLTAPAVDNKANKALVAFAAKLFGIRRSGVSIQSGEKSREKTLLIVANSSPSWPA